MGSASSFTTRTRLLDPHTGQNLALGESALTSLQLPHLYSIFISLCSPFFGFTWSVLDFDLRDQDCNGRYVYRLDPIGIHVPAGTFTVEIWTPSGSADAADSLWGACRLVVPG